MAVGDAGLFKLDCLSPTTLEPDGRVRISFIFYGQDKVDSNHDLRSKITYLWIRTLHRFANHVEIRA